MLRSIRAIRSLPTVVGRALVYVDPPDVRDYARRA